MQVFLKTLNYGTVTIDVTENSTAEDLYNEVVEQNDMPDGMFYLVVSGKVLPVGNSLLRNHGICHGTTIHVKMRTLFGECIEDVSIKLWDEPYESLVTDTFTNDSIQLVELLFSEFGRIYISKNSETKAAIVEVRAILARLACIYGSVNILDYLLGFEGVLARCEENRKAGSRIEKSKLGKLTVRLVDDKSVRDRALARETEGLFHSGFLSAVSKFSLVDIILNWQAFYHVTLIANSRGSLMEVFKILLKWYHFYNINPLHGDKYFIHELCCKISKEKKHERVAYIYFDLLQTALRDGIFHTVRKHRRSAYDGLFCDNSFGVTYHQKLARMCVRTMIEWGIVLKSSCFRKWEVEQEGLVREEYDRFVSGERAKEISFILRELFPDWDDEDALRNIIDWATYVPEMKCSTSRRQFVENLADDPFSFLDQFAVIHGS